MSLERFHEICCKLEGDEQNKDLEYAIQSWCKELNFNEDDIMQYIHQWQEDLSDQTLEKLPFLKNVINLGIKKMKINDIVLIAFVLTGVGVGLYLLDQNQKKSKRDRIRDPQQNDSRYEPIARSRQAPQKNILVLVINAQNNERIIERLDEEEQITSTMWENIYRSTKALWMGKEENFDISGLNSPFSQAETSQPFDYDVYFIKIELDKYVRGFEENADSLERADAFERLTQTKHTVKKISQRLSIRSTENSYLYR